LEPIRDGGGANALATMESVLRYTFDGTTIAVFRGNLGTAAAGGGAANRSEGGVAIHYTGNRSHADGPALAADTPSTETSGGVSVHHGAPPAELARAARGDIG
ncbi:MAG TPA: hypothetical protein VGC10_05450, partial [Sphingomonas sp.]